MNPSGFRVLLDQGLPRDTADQSRTTSVECSHMGEIGMSAASDTEILEYAEANGFLVATLDADFHAMMGRHRQIQPVCNTDPFGGGEGYCNCGDHSGRA
jgi:predicted nuclease of predicted toxin-antitoxin system